MTYHEFKKWDLENSLQGLANQFWMMHPRVILMGMSYWLHYNVDIIILFKWNAGDFQCPYSRPPIVAPKGDHYKEMTMIQIIERYEEYFASEKHVTRTSKTPYNWKAVNTIDSLH
jgi:hypothetical protein